MTDPRTLFSNTKEGSGAGFQCAEAHVICLDKTGAVPCSGKVSGHARHLPPGLLRQVQNPGVPKLVLGAGPPKQTNLQECHSD